MGDRHHLGIHLHCFFCYWFKRSLSFVELFLRQFEPSVCLQYFSCLLLTFWDISLRRGGKMENRLQVTSHMQRFICECFICFLSVITLFSNHLDTHVGLQQLNWEELISTDCLLSSAKQLERRKIAPTWVAIFSFFCEWFICSLSFKEFILRQLEPSVGLQQLSCSLLAYGDTFSSTRWSDEKSPSCV